MTNWKKCTNCGKKISAVYKICPYCNSKSLTEINEYDSNLKRLIDDSFQYAEIIDNYNVYDNNNAPLINNWKSKNLTVKHALFTDFLDWLAFLGKTDGEFSKEEISFINHYLNSNFTANDLNKIVNSKSDINELPTSFKLFYDNEIFHKRIMGDEDILCYTDKLYQIYMVMGDLFIKCDGEGSSEEYDFYKKFLDNLGENFNNFKKAGYKGTVKSIQSIKNEINQKDTNNVLSLLLNCQNISDLDEINGFSISEIRSWFIKGQKGDSNFINFSNDLLNSRPDIATYLTISVSGGGKTQPNNHGGQTSPENPPNKAETNTLNDLLDELNKLIGLDIVKKDVNSLINLIQIRKIRQERGMKQPSMSLHLVFSGNPGTGKTTVARLLSKIYCELGLLSKGHLIETDRSGLVGGYLGQTAIKTQDMIGKAMGGILFIDEAYALTPKTEGDTYGQEAIDTILKAMEDHRDDFIVIVAGYPELMDDFIKSNPGLESRFNKYIYFEDYNPSQLHDIFISMCEDSSLKVDSEADDHLKALCNEMYENRDDNFANARQVRNLFEKVVANQANRLSSIENISDDELMTIVYDDFS